SSHPRHRKSTEITDARFDRIGYSVRARGATRRAHGRPGARERLPVAGRANPPGGGCSASTRSRSHEHARSASDARTASTGVTPACAGAWASIVSLQRRRMPSVSTDVSSEQDEYGKPAY